MQEIAVQVSVFLCECLMAAFAIYLISHHRMTQCAEVDSDLMRTPGFDPDFQKRKTAESLQDSVFGIRRASTPTTSCHLRSLCRMAAHRQLDSSSIFRHDAVDQRHVGFLDLSVLESLAQSCMGSVALGDYQQS